MSTLGNAVARCGDVGDLATLPADSLLLQQWQSPATIWLAADGLVAAAAGILLDAFAVYLDRCDGAARLILLGRADHVESTSALDELTRDMHLAAQVARVDASDPATLKAALLSADALIDLSAEAAWVRAAIALGTPVVGSRRASNLEILGEAALLWDDPAPELVAASVLRLRTDPWLRARVREEGFLCLDRSELRRQQQRHAEQPR